MGRLEKFTLIILGAILENYHPNGRWLEISLIIVGISSYITSIQRLIFTRKLLGDKKEV